MTGLAITILVGTDHHPFDRLVLWADARQREHPEDRVTIQYGSSRAPDAATGVELMTPDELRALVAGSDVVITHGGPGTITDTRRGGHLPIVVGRNPGLGEHVDNHQLLFSAWAAGRGLARLIESTQELDDAIVALGPMGTRQDSSGDQLTALTAQRLEQLLDDLGGRRLQVSADATVLLYLGAASRSGATLLEALLAQLDDVVVLGEVAHLWERGVLADQTCACGARFSKCEFWGQVGKAAFGGWQKVPLERVLTLKQMVDRQRRMPRTLRRHPGADVRAVLIEYSGYYRRVYDAARQVSGASVVVDSSKGAPTALALSHNRHVDLRVLHLVRDARAVANGWPQVADRLDPEDARQLPDLSKSELTRQWVSQNLAIRGLSYRGAKLQRMRYEDLVADPAAAVRSAWHDLGLPGTGELPMLTKDTIEVTPKHSVAGSQLRFLRGPITLRPDTDWTREMAASDRRLVTALAWPLLRTHGYLRKQP